jgi:hypothetical protein
MKHDEHTDLRDAVYRVWIVNRGGWEPEHWSDEPPHGVVIAAAEKEHMSPAEAPAQIEAFNYRVLREPARREWAVAVPVTIRYLGDLKPQQIFRPTSHRLVAI